MISLPIEAHFNTMVPLAWGLQAAGHDVHVASKPRLTDHVTAAGLTAVPMGSRDEHTQLLDRLGTDLVNFYASVDFTGMRDESADKVLSDNDVLVGTFYALENDASFIHELAGYADHWVPELIIWEQFTFAGAVVGAATNIPHGRLVWSPDLFYQMRQKVSVALADRLPWLRDDALRDWLESAVGAFGREFGDDLLFGQWQIELSPPELRLPSPRPSLPIRYVPYNGVSVVEDWVREPPKLPRVALTMGITARSGHYANPVDIKEVLRKLAELDIEVVATLSQAEQAEIGPLPDRVRLVDFVPLRALLPTCDGIIHHGGSGTWASALAAGVPQIVISNLWDNVYRGRQLAELGAGVFLPPAEATPETIQNKLISLMTADGFQTAARRLQESMLGQPAPTDIVPQLEEIATSPGYVLR
ncbi:glycosyltransferase (activator-dependent family) [Saccharopolyspora phatthalungensis]|uniref:Glycosyltransferase (Activator-dependent family) n=2 Tax=Saccharopolyspora phatthalungensis TaxID=664693 RepID=A0A840QDX1_9PSEU|nr:glycosyltransferase (activator-dependent family) [Saccharopolyspora phatthalungensis]